MDILFDKKRKQQSAVEYMMSCFSELLMQHKLKPGDLLPNENNLAESMGISRGTVREGMKILSAFGIVDIKRGDGTYISTTIGDTLLDPFLLSLIMNKHDIREMVEFRQMIELSVVSLVVKNNNENNLSELTEAIEFMKEKVETNEAISPKKWAEVDIAFHHALGKATGNRLIDKLYRFVIRFFAESIERSYQKENNPENAYTLHRDIYEAILGRDENKALAAIMVSITGWEKQYMEGNSHEDY